MDGTGVAQEPQRAERGGLPVWWADVPGNFFASLMFRVGQADEALATRGLTHLVEHLALFALGRREHPFNGFVDDVRCVFFATGEQDEVLDFLHAVAASLRSLPLDRLEAERRVLRAEASGSGDVTSRMRGHRFGAAGYGLVNYQELGLRWLGPEEVAHWAGERFTAGNATLWMTAEPPAGFSLDLPDGPRMPAPEPVPLTMQQPAYLAEGTGGVALTALGRRSTALRAAQSTAADRLYDRLRRDRGLAYAPYADYLILGAEQAHFILGSDCQDDDAPSVLEEIWRIANELADSGPDDEELERHRRKVGRSDGEPDAIRGELDTLAGDELTGATPRPGSVWRAELAELTSADVAAATRELLETAILLGPSEMKAPVPGLCPAVPRSPDPVEDGRRFAPPPARPSGEALTVGDRGVTYLTPDGGKVTIEWDACAAAERRPDGALTLHGHDGSWLTLAPGDWVDGDELIALLLDRLHPRIVIPVADAETADAVERLASERLTAPGAIGEALALLSSALKQGEECLDMADGISDGERGLLALTDRRVLWLTAGGGSELALEDIRDVKVPKLKLFDGPLTLATERSALAVDIRPMSRARELAAAIEQRAA